MINSDEFLRVDLLLSIKGKEIKIFKSRWGDISNNQKNIIELLSRMLTKAYSKEHEIKLFDEAIFEDFKKAITEVIKKHSLIEQIPPTKFEQEILDSALERDPFHNLFKQINKGK